MTLHVYFARRFLMTFLGIFGGFGAFVFILDLVEQIRRFDDEGVAFGALVQLTLLNLPGSLYEMLPLIMILSSIALFLGLSRSSELVIARAAGRSGIVSLVGPMLVALIVGGIAVAAMNPIVAATSLRYSELKELYEDGRRSVISIGSGGLWLRQGDETGQTVIRASRANADATRLYDVSFLEYRDEIGPVRRLMADEAELVDGAWVLRTVKTWPLGPGVNAEANARDYDTLEIPSTLTRERIRDRFGQPSAISIWNLPRFISDLEQAGFSARRHTVWFQMELARPIFLVSLILVAAAFTMEHARIARTGIAVLSAVLIGFGLFYVRNFAQILGESGQLDPLVAAWVPPFASLLLALGFLLQREDG
ncbi:putative permease YjgP/YjgQ family protein [Roseivivax sp. THAF40]|uniref:LPS export ABC transporter permease LptG n=1 Tax=unclassified Roseivivax TaxID=2639302 RepID=UPI0012689E36|nr:MULTISPECIES: LPS export ABC transporter permease LptG [unclassified Roseivivax]QFS82767.1 putative permease YjgP/YjgQ family protein [Roseivivax sp. THAF197b]QFT46536.1 putative permease YjgP/YjgQ family protein [Roseivivax sp. THAF40]